MWIAALALVQSIHVAAKASTPDSAALLGANDSEWILPAKNYEGNPYTGLTQIASSNVGIADGKVFMATLDCRVIALDAGHTRRTGSMNLRRRTGGRSQFAKDGGYQFRHGGVNVYGVL